MQKYFLKQGWSNIDVRVRSNYAIFLAGVFVTIKQLCLISVIKDVEGLMK